MANRGLTSFRYGILTEGSDGTATYGGAKTPGKAVSCNVSITNNSAMLYAEDALAESDTSFQSGTVTIGIDDEDLQTLADLLGHTLSGSGEMVCNANDVAPYVGFGRVITKQVNGAIKYRAVFLKKVKFADPSADNATRGESVEFSTPEIEGTVATLADGSWSASKVFNTKAEAVAYLEGLLGTSTTYTVTYDKNNAGATFNEGVVNPVSVASGSSIELLPAYAMDAPSGKVFAGWATTAAATVANVTSPYTPLANVTLYAVWDDE